MRHSHSRLLALLAASLGGPCAFALDLTTPGVFAESQRNLLVAQEDESALRVGPLDLRAAAAISYGYDSNVDAVADPATGEGLATGQLMLRADDRTARHDFHAQAFFAGYRYQDSSDLDTSEFGAAADFSALLSPRDTFELSLDAQRRFERRSEIETPTTIPVSLYDDLRLSVEQSHAFNRLSVRATVDGRRLQYAADSQEFRDRSLYRGELRAAYELTSTLSWFGSAYFNRDKFDSPSPQVESADTTGGLLGVLMASDIFDFELGAGYFERRFDSGTLDGLALRGALAWRPTRLMELRAQITRSDEPTQVAGAFGKIRNEVLLRLAHEYSRTLSLFVGGRFVVDQFETAADDRLYLAELGANWLIGRHSMLSFTYDYGSRRAESFGRGFERHVANLSFVGRL